jgi:uncharacterized protein
MLAVLSPAKTLDFASDSLPVAGSAPRLTAQTEALVKYARKLKARDLAALMDISDTLAELNEARFKAFGSAPSVAAARPALQAFKGDVYVGLDAESFSSADVQEANARLRILSGLYGLLRPLDLIQPYRLEMGISLATPKAKTLYSFWGDAITQLLAADLEASGSPVLINLASQEYFGAVKPALLPGPVIACGFKEVRQGEAKIVSFFAKKARGLMARYIVQNRIDQPEALKDFTEGGYAFAPKLSSPTEWVFTRQS